MSELIVSSRPELRSPVLIAAFRGWNDGGQGATLGAGFLAKEWGAEQFAEIDSENFYDFQAVRPNVSLEDGMTRKLEWPSNTFLHAPIPGLDRDAVILLGVEPNLRWKTYTALVLELLQELEVELAVTLGSLLADVPHTRPAPVSAAASDPALVEELGTVQEVALGLAENLPAPKQGSGPSRRRRRRRRKGGGAAAKAAQAKQNGGSEAKPEQPAKADVVPAEKSD